MKIPRIKTVCQVGFGRLRIYRVLSDSVIGSTFVEVRILFRHLYHEMIVVNTMRCN